MIIRMTIPYLVGDGREILYFPRWIYPDPNLVMTEGQRTTIELDEKLSTLIAAFVGTDSDDVTAGLFENVSENTLTSSAGNLGCNSPSINLICLISILVSFDGNPKFEKES
jgi:hypothetical protein